MSDFSNRYLKLGWDKVFEAYAGLCVYCLGPADTVDHVIPQFAGGTHHPDNLVPACRPCNESKNAMPLVVWLSLFSLGPEGFARAERPIAPPPPPMKFSLGAAMKRARMLAGGPLRGGRS